MSNFHVKNIVNNYKKQMNDCYKRSFKCDCFFTTS